MPDPSAGISATWLARRRFKIRFARWRSTIEDLNVVSADYSSGSMKAMGLDVGTKTVGIAISDELGFTAQGVKTLRRSNLKADLRALRQLVTEHGVTRLVVGLPLHMDGSEGERAAASRQLGETLADYASLPVEFWDERLSTVAAERVLIEGNVSRQRRKQVIDQVAASIILQSWLDGQPRSGPPEDDGSED